MYFVNKGSYHAPIALKSALNALLTRSYPSYNLSDKSVSTAIISRSHCATIVLWPLSVIRAQYERVRRSYCAHIALIFLKRTQNERDMSTIRACGAI